MADRMCLVTGGNSGIGFELCRGMAAAGFHVVMVSRGTERGQPALEKLQTEFGDSVSTIVSEDILKLYRSGEFRPNDFLSKASLKGEEISISGIKKVFALLFAVEKKIFNKARNHK